MIKASNMKVLDKKFVSYLNTVRVSEKGQLVLPKEYRDEQSLQAGSDMAALKIGNGLLLLPQMAKFDALCGSIEKVLMKSDLTSGDFVETLGETRNELFKEIYPKASKKKSGK